MNRHVSRSIPILVFVIFAIVFTGMRQSLQEKFAGRPNTPRPPFHNEPGRYGGLGRWELTYAVTDRSRNAAYCDFEDNMILFVKGGVRITRTTETLELWLRESSDNRPVRVERMPNSLMILSVEKGMQVTSLPEGAARFIFDSLIGPKRIDDVLEASNELIELENEEQIRWTSEL